MAGMLKYAFFCKKHWEQILEKGKCLVQKNVRLYCIEFHRFFLYQDTVTLSLFSLHFLPYFITTLFSICFLLFPVF